jgi:two-component system, cell cycle sensor histidine kinase and response regulator CckA
MESDGAGGAASTEGLRAEIWRLAAQTELPEEILIQRLLEKTGVALGVQRASYNRIEGESLVCRAEWCAPGVPSSIGSELPAAVIRQMLRDGGPIEVTPTAVAARLTAGQQSVAAAAMTAHAAATGTASLVSVPYAVDGSLEGTLTFKHTSEVTAGWSKPWLPLLAELMQIVTQTIARKRAESALRESERRYRELVDMLPLGVMELDLDGRVTFANQYALETKGLTHDDVRAGVHLRQFVAPQEQRRIPDRLISGPLGARHAGTEYEALRRDGTVFPVAVYATPILRDGRPVRILGIEVDLTPHKRAEQRYRDLADLLPLVVFETDESGRITFFNRHGRALVGVSWDEDLSGVSILDLLAPVHTEVAAERLRSLLAGRTAAGTEYRAHLKDGRFIDCLAYTSVIQRDGAIVGIRGVVVDITEKVRAEAERQRLESEVQHAQRLESLGVLAGGIAHDFNNLLVNVLGNAELALLELGRHPTAAPRLERIRRAARRASDLANQMLAYAGRGIQHVEPVDLTDVVRDQIDLLEGSVSPAASLRFDLREDLPAVQADATQLRQVVMNLVANAAEALGDGPGSITLTTGVVQADRAWLADARFGDALRPGWYVYLDVADTGCGMDDATLSRMFDPFFTTKFVGRGLGLAAVLGIVKSHHGALKVRSAAGGGTTVKVLFPALDQPVAVAPEPAAPSAAHWQGHGRVLVVDDDDDVLAVATDLLQALGFEVCTAASGARALEELRREGAAFALVLLDWSMPTMSGEQAFDRIRAIAPSLPIVVASGYTEVDITGRFAERHPVGVLQKPYDLERLAATMRAVLGDGGGSRARR